MVVENPGLISLYTGYKHLFDLHVFRIQFVADGRRKYACYKGHQVVAGVSTLADCHDIAAPSLLLVDDVRRRGLPHAITNYKLQGRAHSLLFPAT